MKFGFIRNLIFRFLETRLLRPFFTHNSEKSLSYKYVGNSKRTSQTC